MAAFLLSVSLVGQNSSTAYSRFGIGRLYSNNNLLTMGMGGATYASRSNYFVNPFNPASYTVFDSTSFVFDAALQGKLTTLKTSTSSGKVNDAGLAYITMGFPVTKWWKSSLGIMPYSSVNYQIEIDSIFENLGKVRYGYAGSGGLNRAYIGNAFLPFKNLSVGFNFSYIFGTLNRDRTVFYPDSSNHFSSRITNSTIVRNMYLDFGIQYHTLLKNGLQVNAGLVFSPNQSLNSTRDFLAVTYYHDYTKNLDVNMDTAVYESGVDGKTVIPMLFGGGLSVGRANRWNIAGDFQYQDWTDYKAFGISDSLRKSFRISLGGQYKPSPLDVGKYWKRINYRAGVRFEKSFLELRDKSLNEIGISFGVSLPMKKSRSTINLSFETGTFGTTDNQLIKENFFRFTIGAALSEKWFLKRKYD